MKEITRIHLAKIPYEIELDAKKNRKNGTLFGFSVSTEIKILMGISA